MSGYPSGRSGGTAICRITGRLKDFLAWLVERRPHSSDRRVWRLHLTPKALPKLVDLGVLADRARAEALADIPQAERDQLLQTLTQLKSDSASACPVAQGA